MVFTLRTRGVAFVVGLLAWSTIAFAQPASSAPAAAGGEMGTLSGVVIDKSNGSPIIEAGVEIIDHGKTLRTDLDGKYSVKLPAGTYQIRYFAPLYQGTRLQNVVVTAGQVTKQDVNLAAAQANVEVVEVVAQANKAAEATQLLQRKKAAVVSETVSAEAIKKTPDSDAAKVVQRVPAVTVKDNKYVFVRGLSERYSSALLDGSRLPSPDPNRRLVPLDLFPSEFISNLQVQKSYSADVPGDFSGGLVSINLREFPEKYSLTMGSSVGVNSQTTGQRFRTYDGGDYDFLGLGAGSRSLPSDVPSTKAFQRLGNAAADRIGRSFPDTWNLEAGSKGGPNVGLNASVGDSIGPVGFSFAGVYGSEWVTDKDAQVNNYVSTDAGPFKTSHAITDTSVFKTRLAGLMTTEYKVDPDNKLTFRALVDHNSYDSVDFLDGVNVQHIPERQYVLRYTEDQLDFGQLSGSHALTPWFVMNWRTAFARTTEVEPDIRFVTYEADPKRFTTDDFGGDRLFDNLTELLTDSAVDFSFTFPLWQDLKGSFKTGPAYEYRTRTFEQRRFGILQASSAVDLRQPPETVLSPDNLVPGVLQFEETTRKDDSYDVSQEVMAYYGMFDLPLIKDLLRLNAGVRPEYSYIRLHGFATGSGSVKNGTGPFRAIKNNLDYLPGVNLTLSPRDDMNIRASWSRTVARPEFRELSPVLYPSSRFRRQLFGNPNLIESHQENIDLRWEWFMSPLEILSAGYFHKTLDNPIERVTANFGSFLADSERNAAPGATVDGFELEGRKNLDFISSWLKGVNVQTNYTWVNTRTFVPSHKTDADFAPGGGHSHALQGQARYVVNASLEYEDPRWGTYRLLYNRAGRRIDSIGIMLPDIIEESRNSLDFVTLIPVKLFDVPLTVKFSAQNLLDSPYLFTQAGNIYQKYNRGVTIGIGFSYTY